MLSAATLLGWDKDHWEIVGVAAGTVVPFAGALALAYRRAVRPVLAAIRRGLEQLEEVRDEVLGTDERPSLAARIEAGNARMDEHLRWHGPAVLRPVPVPARRR